MTKKLTSLFLVLVLLATTVVNCMAASVNGFEYSAGNKYSAFTADALILRNQSNAKLAVVPNNTIVEVYGVYSKDTSRLVISYNGTVGTIVKGYLAYAHTPNNSYSLTTDSLILRDEQGNKITVVPSGAKLYVYGTYNKNTSRSVVKYGDKVGTVVNGYFASAVQDWAVTTDALNFRTETGAYKYTIPKNSLVRVNGVSKGDSSRIDVSYYGDRGTVLGSYCKKLDNAIFVSIAKQKVSMVRNGKLLYQGDCVTGLKGKMDTPTGVYAIERLAEDRILRGTNLDGTPYEAPVDYWIQFYGTYGLHDAKKRASFGGNIYKTNGSHGCVNLPLSLARNIYNNAFVGMKVYISK